MAAQRGSITCRKRYYKTDLSDNGPFHWSKTEREDDFGTRPFYDAVLDSFNIPYRRPSSIKLEIPKRKHTTTNDVLRKSPAIANQYDGPSDTEKRALSISTLPRINPRTSNFRRRPSLKTFASSTSSGSFRSPDRFLPIRSTLDSAVESFRTSKDPRTLTMDEKLLRHKDASQDAFNPRRRATSPIPSSNRPVPRRNFSGNRSGSGGASVLTFQRDPTAVNGERQVSVGTIWRVGGLAPVSGVPNGRGGLVGSGTNAPLYTTSFTAKPKAQEDKERHESRLAEALELDRVGRVFEFRDPSTSPLKLSAEESQTPSGKDFKTSWLGTEWVLGGPDRKAPIAEEIRTLPMAPFK
ncbi:hypothetical protein ACEPPN_008367 [Leptodophora sp. 'Broadleaf-Isolate-01']